MKKLLLNNEKILKKAELVDASIKYRRKNYSTIDPYYPLFGTKAKGAYLWDVDNNKYIDYTMGYGTIILGHSDDRVNQAVIEEINLGTCFSPMWKEVQIKLGEEFQRIIPSAELAFFMKTGSDATSGAIRLARCYNNKDIVLRYGYNGWHDWSTPRPLGVPKDVSKNTKIFSSLNQLYDFFKKYKDNISSVIMMPFEFNMPETGWLEEIIDMTHKNNAVFILDEMRTGFRLSLGGAQEYFNIKPDLSTFSKAMANGYAISAIVGKEKYFKDINNTKMTATYFGSSFEMAASLKTIDVLKKNNCIESIWENGRLLIKELNKLIIKYKVPAEVNNIPPMPYIDFFEESYKKEFYIYCIKRGILFHPNHHWYISASHSKEDIMKTLKICEDAFEYINNLKRKE